MGVKLPRQVALVLEAFPASVWAPQLVQAVNQFALEVVQAFLFTIPKYKVLIFATSENQEDSFPIDFPVEAIPTEVRVAAELNQWGGDSRYAAMTIRWSPVIGNNGQPCVRVNFITGLNSDSSYSIRLAYQ